MPRPKKEAPNHAGGLYEIKITIGKTVEGKLIRKSFYSSESKADAKKQAQQYVINKEVAERTVGQFVDHEVTFGEWALKWLEVYKKGKVKGNTYYGTYQNPVEKHLIPKFGGILLKDIKPVDVQNYFAEMKKKYALETLIKIRNCMKEIYVTAIENDLCYKNPVTKSLKITSVIPPTPKRAYTKEESEKIIQYAKTHKEGLAIIVLLETGISRSELLGLKWEDIDYKDSVIYINQGTVSLSDPETGKYMTVSQGLKNAYRQRFIPISRDLLNMIIAKPCRIPVGGNKRKGIEPKIIHTEYIFHGPRGGVYNPRNWSARVYDSFMADMHKAYPEIPILSCHELRHTKATLLKDDGVDLFTIAKILGHSNLDMLSKRYAHNTVEALKKALGLED